MSIKKLKQVFAMETTLNIHIDTLEQIYTAAQYNNVSCAEIIALLMLKVMKSMGHPESIGRLVRYQKRSNPDNWHTFHIKVREDMYEYWLDLRKVLKMSVSLILAYAVKKYLAKILKWNSTDNYQFRNYIIIKEKIDSIIIWKFIWGIPPNIGKYIN